MGLTEPLGEWSGSARTARATPNKSALSEATGITVETPHTLLTRRAVDYLGAGPADSRTLIAHVCQLPAMPAVVAEHMAAALFAGYSRFVREPDGRWGLVREVAFPADDGPKVFVCGSTRFVDAAADGLVRLGYDPGWIRTERFGATG